MTSIHNEHGDPTVTGASSGGVDLAQPEASRLTGITDALWRPADMQAIPHECRPRGACAHTLKLHLGGVVKELILRAADGRQAHAIRTDLLCHGTPCRHTDPRGNRLWLWPGLERHLERMAQLRRAAGDRVVVDMRGYSGAHRLVSAARGERTFTTFGFDVAFIDPAPALYSHIALLLALEED